MGVPKFYRWLSERYPCINENVNQYNIPEFDNFYVDMNGVFHTCSHPSDDVHFRLTEQQIFENIGLYVEFLFNLVQPRKVFFLSVDGVAPRSKMNQQRSRRYRTAKEAIEKEEKARRLGESLPDDPRFDSNCITPGTEFMNKLHDYMVEFLKNKVQKNQSWREVEVIYSGYDVPGEGEHKIMDYVRYSKTTNTFDKNVRHCLYGLDADLINLGLSCHEPYFSLLREEVTFSKNNRRHCDPFKTNFQLLHLSILRDYLNMEFEELKPKLKFEYSLEKIIDDWILMNFLIGNDFLPHIPKFHVDKGSIQILYDTYKEVLPTLDGYLNHEGTIQLPRYRKYLQKLAQYDMDLFNGTTVDLKYFNQDFNAVTFGDNMDGADEPFDFENGVLVSSDETTSDDKEDDTLDDDSEEDIEQEFIVHKNNYYRTKLHFENLETDVLNIVNEYIKGVQWVLYYYFNGCVSWNWFYPFYYAPYVSDMCKFDIVDYQFQKSTPFNPLVQLLGVIPQASKEILPKAYQQLTMLSDSPLSKFFPKDVEIDLNEKIHDYEAIVLIPFIEEKTLLGVFHEYERLLTSEEVHRNKFGAHVSLMYSDLPADDEEESQYPNVKVNCYDMEHYVLPPEVIFKGVRRNVDLTEIIGFPTLSGINYTSRLENARLKVFRFNSQNPSMILTIDPTEFTPEQLMDFAKKQLGQMVFINWPLLTEAKLLELVDSEQKYTLNSKNQVAVDTVTKYELGYAKQISNGHCSKLRNNKGVTLEEVNVMAKVVPLQSQKYIITGGKVILHKEWSKTEQYVPLDLLICPKSSAQKMPMFKSLNTVFTKGKSFFLIDQPHYGYKADVIEYIKSKNMVKVNIRLTSEPDFSDIQNNADYILEENYIHEGDLARELKSTLKVSENAIKRLFGSVLVNYKADKGREKKMNIGLKLKYKSNYEMNIKPHCIPGYSMFYGNDMYYNVKLISIFETYGKKFPGVFKMLGKQHKPLFEIEDLFNDPQLDKGERVKMLSEIRDWLDSLELSKIGHFKSTAQYLDNCLVKAIEETLEAHSVLMCEEDAIEELIPPANFYISEFVLKGSTLPDPKVKFYLYDRVVNIKKCIAVPFGAKGTVIGIYRKDDELNTQRGEYGEVKLEAKNDEPVDYLEKLMTSVIEVIFDEPFDGGLKTRSTKPNIYKMQASWLINVTYGLMNARKVPNFRNNYQSIQSYNRGQQPKTSTPNSKVGRQPQQPYQQPPYQPFQQPQQSYKQVLSIKNNPVPKLDKQPPLFNHSENSPFKILSRNTQASNAAGQGNNYNPGAHEFVPRPSAVPYIATPQPKSLPMPAYMLPAVGPPPPQALPSADSISLQLKSMLNMGTSTKGGNAPPKKVPPMPQPPAILPSHLTADKPLPMKPPTNWIASAKIKSTEKGGGNRKPQEPVKSMVFTSRATSSRNQQQNGSVVPGEAVITPVMKQEEPAPPAVPQLNSITEQQQQPPLEEPILDVNTLHPTVASLFQNHNLNHGANQSTNSNSNNHRYPNSHQSVNYRNGRYPNGNHNRGYANGNAGSAPHWNGNGGMQSVHYRGNHPAQAYTRNNFEVDVSLNQQTSDVKQFVPLQVARNHQHARNNKLKQQK